MLPSTFKHQTNNPEAHISANQVSKPGKTEQKKLPYAHLLTSITLFNLGYCNINRYFLLGYSRLPNQFTDKVTHL